MKANSILKIAVVAMAAFGAYAFSGNTSSQSTLYIHKDSQCRNVILPCDLDGDFSCKIITQDNDQYPVWMDTSCLIEAKHSTDKPIKVKL